MHTEQTANREQTSRYIMRTILEIYRQERQKVFKNIFISSKANVRDEGDLQHALSVAL